MTIVARFSNLAVVHLPEVPSTPDPLYAGWDRVAGEAPIEPAKDSSGRIPSSDHHV